MNAGGIENAAGQLFPVRIVLREKIRPWQRPITGQSGRTGRKHRYTAPRVEQFVDRLNKAASEAMSGRRRITCCAELSVLAVWRLPKGAPAAARRFVAGGGLIRKITGPDIDNGALKLVMDALQGTVYEVDAQVTDLVRIAKRYGSDHRLEVTVTPVADFDSASVAEISQPPRFEFSSLGTAQLN